MTTTIIVQANHGWPVDVTPIAPRLGMPQGDTKRVPAGTEERFYVTSSQDLRVTEVQPDQASQPPATFRSPVADAPSNALDPLMQFFAYSHLPPHLQTVSKAFGELAFEIERVLPRNPERTVALRKLLEAKDCAVRAVLFK